MVWKIQGDLVQQKLAHIDFEGGDRLKTRIFFKQSIIMKF